MVYGKTDLMLSKYCPITKSYGVNKLDCNLCMNRDHYLKDVHDNEFKIIRDGYCNVRILDSKYLNLIQYLDDLKNMGVNTFRLNFTDESYYETKNIIKAFSNKLYKSNYDLIDLEFTTLILDVKYSRLALMLAAKDMETPSRIADDRMNVN